MPDESLQKSVTIGDVFEATPGFFLVLRSPATIVGVFGLKRSGISEISLICGGD